MQSFSKKNGTCKFYCFIKKRENVAMKNILLKQDMISSDFTSNVK